MASENWINTLKQTGDKIRTIDRERLMRPNLGEASLTEVLEPKLAEIERKISFAITYAPDVHDDHVGPVVGVFDAIQSELHGLASIPGNAEYIGHSEQLLANLNGQLNLLKVHWPPIVTAAIESRGFLEDEGIKKAHDKAIEEMKSQAETVLGEVRRESEETIGKARELAEQIENRARRTAARISVEDAQMQFREAQSGLDKQVLIWSVLSAIFLVSFLGVALLLWFQEVATEVGPAIYFTAIRLTLLGGVGAVATFSLRVLRAHLHMRQHNLHRQRVANSMAAFVESAVTPEQRDLILSQLVQSVAAFGASGLVRDRDDHVSPSRFAIESVTRSVGQAEPK